MIILNLRTYINRNYIISEHLHPTDMLGYMDSVIDDINDDLQANYPTFSEWPAFCDAYNAAYPDATALDPNDYNVIPDSYLKKVVAPGAALKFYSNDEEGEQAASKFYIDYEKARATMVRDYIHLVPAVFQNNTGGYVEHVDNLDPVGVEMYNENNSL
jgi:hypothetical protein